MLKDTYILSFLKQIEDLQIEDFPPFLNMQEYIYTLKLENTSCDYTHCLRYSKLEATFILLDLESGLKKNRGFASSHSTAQKIYIAHRN